MGILGRRSILVRDTFDLDNFFDKFHSIENSFNGPDEIGFNGIGIELG